MGMVRKCFMFNDMNVDDAPGKEGLANLIGKGQAANFRRSGGIESRKICRMAGQ